MEKIPIGLVIKKIIEEKNFSITELSEQLGMSRATIYSTFGRDRMKKSDIEKWATALGVSTDVLRKQEMYGQNESSTKDFGAEIIQTIERLFQEELREKNEQIRRLQDIVSSTQDSLRESQRLASALLGKLHEYPASPVMPHILASAPMGAVA